MHNSIILWEPSDAAYSKQVKIGKLFMNSLGIMLDENVEHEISNIYYLSKDYSKSMTDVEKSLKKKMILKSLTRCFKKLSGKMK